MRRSKWLLGIIVLGLAIAYSTYKYVYKPHKTTEELTVDYTGNSNDFLIEINKNSTNWLNKTVQINGKISLIDNKGITLDNNIYCQFREDISIALLKADQSITIKGKVIGYDDLLEELKLNQCIIIK